MALETFKGMLKKKVYRLEYVHNKVVFINKNINKTEAKMNPGKFNKNNKKLRHEQTNKICNMDEKSPKQSKYIS